MTVWKRANRKDLAAVRGFLARREWACCSLAARIVRSGRLEIPPPDGSRLCAYLPGGGGAGNAGALLLRGRSGCVYPALGEAPPESDGDLIALADIDPRRTSVCMGSAGDVSRIEAALGLSSLAGDDYFLMVRGMGRALAVPEPPIAGLVAARARKEDLDALFPMQEAYEKEEVLAPIHSSDPRAVRRALAASIETQAMLIASLDGKPVAKAQTNARGLLWDQLGGIYVEPEYRGRGVGTYLVARLCALLAESGRGATLFVKKRNAPAISLYKRLGFEFTESYRISYYS